MQSFNQILDGLEQIEADALARFNELARAIAAGKSVDTAEVVDILRASNMTKKDLASVVSLLERRRSLRAKIDEIDRARERMLELRRLIEEENSVLEKHVAEHQERCRPLQNELRDIELRRMSWGDPQQELLKSCGDPDLRHKMGSLLRQRHQASEKLDKARGNLRRAQSAVGCHDYMKFPDERKRIDRWVERAKKELGAIETEISQLAQQTDELEQQLRHW